MIFALLTKVLAFYVQITIVQIMFLEFEQSIRIVPRICWSQVSSLFHINLYKLSKEYTSWAWL